VEEDAQVHRFLQVALLLSAFVLIAAGASYAQSVTIAPSSPSIVVNGQIQFTAQVSGLTSSAVNWSAGGAIGGNSTAGTITSAGLYSAPATPPGQNPVQITATSAADGTTKGITYAYILNRGPSITTVSPQSSAGGHGHGHHWGFGISVRRQSV
jgi:hypothetical protein